MHTERGTSDTHTEDEDFFSALALLHSTDENSAEKLRRMLDACIEKKCGADKTLAARMPRRFLQNIDDAAVSGRDYVQGQCADQTTKGNKIRHVSETVVTRVESVVAGNITNRRTPDTRAFEINYYEEECCDYQNVPRISIPDEGSADGVVCKICNGAKLGPLILLECQECQETYHPLCHQPPVIDVDVYDPRFVWRCRRCVETSLSSSASSAKGRILERESVQEKARRKGDRIKGNANISGLKVSGRRNGGSSRKYGLKDLPAENRSEQLRDSPLFAKDLANNLSQRNGRLSSSIQSRKRIGSKLSVTRTSIK